jgi:hypothetical protein
VNHEDQKRALSDLSLRLNRGDLIAEGEMQQLASMLSRIGAGEDANQVLRVKPNRGQKRSDVVANQRMSLILHWVAGCIYPDPDSDEKAMTVAQACEAAVNTIVPVAKQIFPGADDCTYEVEYLQRCWHDKQRKYRRSPLRSPLDPDFPY